MFFHNSSCMFFVNEFIVITSLSSCGLEGVFFDFGYYFPSISITYLPFPSYNTLRECAMKIHKYIIVLETNQLYWDESYKDASHCSKYLPKWNKRTRKTCGAVLLSLQHHLLNFLNAFTKSRICKSSSGWHVFNDLSTFQKYRRLAFDKIPQPSVMHTKTNFETNSLIYNFILLNKILDT